MMSSSSTHFPANDIISLSFMAEKHFFVYIYYIFFIHSMVVVYLGWFHSFAIVKSTVLNVDMQVSLFLFLVVRDLNSGLCEC
jgi:hypothetical protein